MSCVGILPQGRTPYDGDIVSVPGAYLDLAGASTLGPGSLAIQLAGIFVSHCMEVLPRFNAIIIAQRLRKALAHSDESKLLQGVCRLSRRALPPI